MFAFTVVVVSALLSLLASATPLPLAQSQSVEKRQSAIPYGQVIFSCTVPGTFALTFDDGPYIYTSALLDLLDQNGVKATFFQNGQNYGNIYDYAAVVQRMVSSGHQIASHTWDHPYLSQLSDAAVTSEMTQLEAAYTSIVGFFPTYMRPPYFDYSAHTLALLGGLGYHIIQCDIDTLDYENDSPALIQNAYNNFQAGLNNGGTLELSHDVHQNTVNTLVQEMINAIRAKGLNPVPVGECLGDPAANWYRTSR